MTNEKATDGVDFYPKRLYPDNASSSPYIKRLDNREESLLGTFIQWVGPAKCKKPARSSVDDTQATGQLNDAADEILKKSTRVEFMKQKRTESPDILANSNKGDCLNKLSLTTKFLEDVHISRPATPQPPPKHTPNQNTQSDFDKYRIMYLLVRVEQQEEHLRRVIENMKKLDHPKSETLNMVHILKAVSKRHGLLVGLRDNDRVIIEQIGNRNDIEEFLLTVENECSSVEEIPVPGTSDDKMARLLHHTRNTIDKMERTGNHLRKRGDMTKHDNTSTKTETNESNLRTQPKLRRRRNTPPNCLDIMKRLQTRSPSEQGVNSTLKDCVHDQTKNQPNNVTTQDVSTKGSSSLPEIDKHGMEGSELNTLMKEIDDLMDDTGLITGKPDNMLSYEVIMLGAGENKHKQTNHKQAGHKRINKPDVFIEELDKLLDECESV